MKSDADNRYLAYGTIIASPLDLGEYLCAAGDVSASVLRLAPEEGKPVVLPRETKLFTGHGRKLVLFTDRELAESANGQPWCFEVADVVRFRWIGGAEEIQFERLTECTDQLLAFWLIHIFLPLYFTLEGRYEFIHACSVEVSGSTILFTAPSHGGKSTLTDYFIKQGHTLVSDDKVATWMKDEICFAAPSHPNHRPYRQFEDLGYRVENFDPEPRQVGAIYALQRVESDADVGIEEITGHRKFAVVRPSYLFDFAFFREKRLEFMGRLLGGVGVYRVSVPWDMQRLREIHDRIVTHMTVGD